MFPGGHTHAEIEEFVRTLRPFGPDKVGTPDWKRQRQRIELFNIASHRAAQRKSDDFVLSSLVSHEPGMSTLVQELLVAEAMRTKVYGEVLPDLANTPAGIYLYINYEGILVNLLECLLYHEEAVTGLGDSVLDLIDYCWRTVTVEFLSGSPHAAAGSLHQQKYDPAVQEDAKKIAAMTNEERLSVQVRDMMVRRALGCVSVLWFIVERIPALPLAAVNAILNKHDLLVGVAALIEAHPWTVASKSKNAVYKFKGGQFVETPADDLPLVCSTEAHAWFILHYLMCDRDCRNRYAWNRFRKEQILRVKRFLNEVLVDQLPALVDMQRAVEELSFMEPPSGTDEKFKTNMLLIDQVSQIQTALSSYKDWGDAIAAFKTVLTKETNTIIADAKLVSQIVDWMELDGGGAEAEAVIGSEKAKK